jgi:4-aminobutyrate aminotransferase/(S)-3-amino-2-methylpropionate transaminase
MAYPYRWPGGAEHCAERPSHGIDQIHAQVGAEQRRLP